LRSPCCGFRRFEETPKLGLLFSALYHSPGTGKWRIIAGAQPVVKNDIRANTKLVFRGRD
jgi:hypothetical protein